MSYRVSDVRTDSRELLVHSRRPPKCLFIPQGWFFRHHTTTRDKKVEMTLEALHPRAIIVLSLVELTTWRTSCAARITVDK